MTIKMDYEKFPIKAKNSTFSVAIKAHEVKPKYFF